jgi:hypothetical protein
MYRIQALLALSAALIAAGALAASSQAACGTEWCISGKGLKTGESAELAKAATVTKAELSIPMFGIVAECSKFESQKAFLTGPNTGKAEGISFSGCAIKGSSCKLGSSTITTVPLKSGPAKPVEGSGKEGESITSPETGTTLTTVEFVGGECAITGKQAINGSAREIAPTGQEEKTEQEIVVKSGEVKVGAVTGHMTIEEKIKLASGSPMKLG